MSCELPRQFDPNTSSSIEIEITAMISDTVLSNAIGWMARMCLRWTCTTPASSFFPFLSTATIIAIITIFGSPACTFHIRHTCCARGTFHGCLSDPTYPRLRAQSHLCRTLCVHSSLVLLDSLRPRPPAAQNALSTHGPPQPRSRGSQVEAALCTGSNEEHDTTIVIDASVLVHTLESLWRWSYKVWCYGQRGYHSHPQHSTRSPEPPSIALDPVQALTAPGPQSHKAAAHARLTSSRRGGRSLNTTYDLTTRRINGRYTMLV
ncbi:hypothetical protein F5887DRAFT_614280 [Amanita rubescens]|nr:hypothetical protein F5887DRAFT_614280 [Amanita rubescens]